MSDAFTRLPEYQKPEFLKWTEEKQMGDSMRMMNILVDTCFDKCVNTGWGGGIKTKTLDETEQKCVVNCVEKYFKLANRVSFRWDEHITNVQNQSK